MYYLYVIVRDDLSPSQRVVQACHAATEITKFYPIPPHIIPNLIVCAAHDEAALRGEADRLRGLQIPHIMFTEPDMGDQATALATPMMDKTNRKHFRKLKLLS